MTVLAELFTLLMVLETYPALLIFILYALSSLGTFPISKYPFKSVVLFNDCPTTSTLKPSFNEASVKSGLTYPDTLLPAPLLEFVGVGVLLASVLVGVGFAVEGLVETAGPSLYSDKLIPFEPRGT